MHTSADDAQEPHDTPVADARYRRSGGAGRDTLLDRPVELRACTAEPLAEARFLARLQHAGLPCVHDVLPAGSGASLVLQPLPGPTLSAALAQRAGGARIPAIADSTSCVITFIAICDALSAAHLRGVVHGAIAPGVIVLGDAGQIRIDGWQQAMRTVQRPLTRRFVAHEPQADGPPDGLQQDIRDTAACLFTALIGEAPPRKRDGGLEPAAAAAAVGLHPGLLRIVMQAMSSDASTGYLSMAELRAALVGHLADSQAAADHGLGRRLRAFTAAAARPLALIALIGVIAASAVLATAWPSLHRYATWGSIVVEEHFDDDSWAARWAMRGRWERKDGRIVSQSEAACALILRQRLTPPVAIEYTGRFSATVHPGDLSVWWCEDDAATLRPDEDTDNARGWFIQAGAYTNSWCCIWQTPDRLRTQVGSLVLEPDRDYRFRVEIGTDTLRMLIDGRQVLEHRELFPIGSGTIALYTWDPGKTFADVSVWQSDVPQLISPLAIGDEAYRAGRFADADAAYARVAQAHRGSQLGTDALYYQGMAQRRQGAAVLARKTWDQLPPGDLRLQAEALIIDDLVAQGELANAAERFRSMWRDHPGLRPLLRQRWQSCGQRLMQVADRQPAVVEAWIGLRDQTFADDQASAWLVADLLNRMGRWDETIRRFPDEHRAVAPALVALGRGAEVLAAPWSLPEERIRAMVGLGDVEAALRSPDLNRGLRASLLCKLGRAEEAALLAPYPALLYLGRGESLLEQNISKAMANTILIASGRLAEAAGAGVAGSPRSGNDPTALLLLGRLDEAEQQQADTRLFQLLEQLTIGDLAAARALRADAELSLRRNNATAFASWFGKCPGLGLVDVALGEPDALRRALERGASATGFGGRMALVCSAVLDPAQEPALLAMPWRTEAEAWLLIARALRGELAGKSGEALDAWRAFAALPPLRRLLVEHRPSTEVQAFANWRIAALRRDGRAP